MTDLDALHLPDLPQPVHAQSELLDLLQRSADSRELEVLDARHTLLAAIEDHHPLIANGGLPGWLELWRAGMHPALQAAAADVKSTAAIARAALRLAGELRGPDVHTAGVTVAVGDTVIAQQTTRLAELHLEAGVPVHVTDIDHAARTLTMDVPTLGTEARVTAGDTGFRSLTYAYAEPPSTERDLGRHRADRNVGLSW